MDQYVPIRQVPCGVCSETPVVGINTPGGQIVCSGLCGPCFFGDRVMLDPEEWNRPKEATE